jgi:hypothetical protein
MRGGVTKEWVSGLMTMMRGEKWHSEDKEENAKD